MPFLKSPKLGIAVLLIQIVLILFQIASQSFVDRSDKLLEAEAYIKPASFNSPFPPPDKHAKPSNTGQRSVQSFSVGGELVSRLFKEIAFDHEDTSGSVYKMAGLSESAAAKAREIITDHLLQIRNEQLRACKLVIEPDGGRFVEVPPATSVDSAELENRLLSICSSGAVKVLSTALMGKSFAVGHDGMAFGVLDLAGESPSTSLHFAGEERVRLSYRMIPRNGSAPLEWKSRIVGKIVFDRDYRPFLERFSPK